MTSPSHWKTCFEKSIKTSYGTDIKIHQVISQKTGLTVVLGEIPGPLVNGGFLIPTEEDTHLGRPHTLEHLIYFGSSKYPKGCLDLVANRSLANGTNAWTATNCTCYTCSTVGAQGFLQILPVYLDALLWPLLNDQSFDTEVHHITGQGKDAGVVYCEMEGIEKTGKPWKVLKTGLYPSKTTNYVDVQTDNSGDAPHQDLTIDGGRGYRMETGGILHSLRKLTNEQIKDYHTKFYRPENMCLMITGQILLQDILKALDPIEEMILKTPKFAKKVKYRPWTASVPPLIDSNKPKLDTYLVPTPSDEESEGKVYLSWRTKFSLKDTLSFKAIEVLLEYLTDTAISPFKQEFVECDEPIADNLSIYLNDYNDPFFLISFSGVPAEKLTNVRNLVFASISKIVQTNDINIDLLQTVISNLKSNYSSEWETAPDDLLQSAFITHFLYSPDKSDFKLLNQQFESLSYYQKLSEKPESYWIDLLKSNLLENPCVCVAKQPSKACALEIDAAETKRVQVQKNLLGAAKLKELNNQLESSVRFNSQPVDSQLLSWFPVPPPDSSLLNSFEIMKLDTSNTLGLGSFQAFHSKFTDFCFISLTFPIQSVSNSSRLLIPLIFEMFFQNALVVKGQRVSSDSVVLQVNELFVSSSIHTGHTNPSYDDSLDESIVISLSVKPDMLSKSVKLIHQLLYCVDFEEKPVLLSENDKSIQQRINSAKSKLILSASNLAQSGWSTAYNIYKYMNLNEFAVRRILNPLFQKAYLKKNIDPTTIPSSVSQVEQAHKDLFLPKNLHLCTLLPSKMLQTSSAENFFSDLYPGSHSPTSLPDLTVFKSLLRSAHKFSNPDKTSKVYISSMKSLESNFLFHYLPISIQIDHPDIAGLLIAIEYLSGMESAFWKRIRGQGLAYGARIAIDFDLQALRFRFYRSTDPIQAHKEALSIFLHFIIALGGDKPKGFVPDPEIMSLVSIDDILLESAQSSLIHDIGSDEKSVVSSFLGRITDSFGKTTTEFRLKTLINRIRATTLKDVKRIALKYFSSWTQNGRVAITCAPSKCDSIKEYFESIMKNVALIDFEEFLTDAPGFDISLEPKSSTLSTSSSS